MTTDELMALADECATSFFKFVRYGHDIEYGERYEAARTALRSALEAAVGERDAARALAASHSDECEKWAAMHQRSKAEIASLKAATVVDAWVPHTPAEVRDFLGSHCSLLRWGDPSNPTVAVENDLYELTAHDVLSAFRWAGHYDKEIAATMAQTKETP